jgi:hypothetical protein
MTNKYVWFVRVGKAADIRRDVQAFLAREKQKTVAKKATV